mmetsp:Transcript_27368/g.50247  ORF Transcript_27368/g.50247 Transcript_27368/m.50247 type:complete len:272 (-) Transcript_27368:548-1363(-)
MPARRHPELTATVFLDRLFHEFLEHRTTGGAAISPPPKRTRAVMANIAARHDIAGKAHKPNVLGFVGSTGFTRNRHWQIDLAGRGTTAHDTFHHRGQLIGGDRIHHPLPVGHDARPAAFRNTGVQTIGTIALVVTIDRLAVTVLYTVHQRRLNTFAPIGKHRIGRHHLIERGLIRAERIRQESPHVVIDTKTFCVACNGFHAHFLRQTNGHQVPAHLNASPQRSRTVKLVGRVLRTPHTLGRVDFNWRVNHDRGRAITTVQRRGIDKRLKA